MKKLFALMCLMAILLCGCSQSDSDSSSGSDVESLSSEPYYMEDLQCLYENGVFLNLLDLEIVSVGDERNLEDTPVLLVSYIITNNTGSVIDVRNYQEQHLDVLYNYESGGKGFRPSNANIDPDAFPMDYDNFHGQSIKPDTTGTYLSAFKVTDNLETVTLRFIADDAANPLGVETYALSEISESTLETSSEQSSEDELASEPTAEPTPAETDTTTMGERNALKSAQSYLDYSAFSYEGLIEQLEFEGYSNDEATYAADNCGADWNEQALKSAKSYLEYSAFSYTGLIEQLEFEGFTANQATYGADNCGADWNEQAAKSAESYLEYSSFSRDGLIEQLEFEGFTHEQAVYGAEANGY